MLVIHPGPPRELPVDEAYARPLGHRTDRPWVGVSMVASIDGSTVLDGTSGGLSGDVDHAVMLRLRSLAQVVLVGAGTADREGYRSPSSDLRIGVVTRSGTVDTSSELFASGAGFVVTTESAKIATNGSVDIVRAGRDEVDLRLAIELIGELVDDLRFIQVEGGPSLNGAVVDADLFDELDLTTSPAMIGGDGPRIVSGASTCHQAYDLAQLATADDFVFTRWRRARRDESVPGVDDHPGGSTTA